MKFFTIQHKDVIYKLLEDGEFYADYEKSPSNQIIKSAYNEMLANYNVVNDTEEKGLIFGFHSINGNCEIEDIEEIYNLLEQRTELQDLFKDIRSGDYIILELEIDTNKNLISIDFNDYIKLALWANYLRNYNEELLTVFENEFEARKEILKIKKYLPNGNWKSERASFIQIHYPVIKLRDIKNIYEIIDFETGKLVEFRNYAVELIKRLGL